MEIEGGDIEEEGPKGRVRWLTFSLNGIVFCQINEADSSHLRIVKNVHGRHMIAEFNTKSVLASSLTGGP